LYSSKYNAKVASGDWGIAPFYHGGGNLRNKLATLVLGGLTLVGTASANIITAGGSGAPDTFDLTGMTLKNSISGPLNAVTYTGTYTSAVYSGSNALCGSGSNCLTFTYQVTDNAATGVGGDPGIIAHVTSSPFSGFMTDVGYSTTVPSGGVFTSTGTVMPNNVSRTSGSGPIVEFDFGFNNTGAMVTPGTTSSILVIETNATMYQNGLFSSQDGSTVTVNAFAPVATPEPGTIVLLGSGLVLVGLARRKRAKA
jgi:hypothetical protein